MPRVLFAASALLLAVAGCSATGTTTESRPEGAAPTAATELPAPTPAGDGSGRRSFSLVAAPSLGSSDPTRFATNKRLVETAGGRILIIHGRHREGVQLAWRDGGTGGWSSTTRGVVRDGLVLAGTGTGDWTASIALVKTPAGAEEAWLAFAHDTFRAEPGRVIVAHVVDLDAVQGPEVVSVDEVTPPEVFTKRADVAARDVGGTTRVALTWTERVGSNAAVRTAWIAPPEGGVRIENPSTLMSGYSREQVGSFVAGAQGFALIARGPHGEVRLFRNGGGAGDGWIPSEAAAFAGEKSAPHGVALQDGTVVVAMQPDPDLPTAVTYRFSADGSQVVLEHTQPEAVTPALGLIAGEPWLTYVRSSDRAVMAVPRRGGAWEGEVLVLDPRETGGNADSPNVMRSNASDELRLVVRGVGLPTSRSGVVYVEIAVAP